MHGNVRVYGVAVVSLALRAARQPEGHLVLGRDGVVHYAHGPGALHLQRIVRPVPGLDMFRCPAHGSKRNCLSRCSRATDRTAASAQPQNQDRGKRRWSLAVACCTRAVCILPRPVVESFWSTLLQRLNVAGKEASIQDVAWAPRRRTQRRHGHRRDVLPGSGRVCCRASERGAETWFS